MKIYLQPRPNVCTRNCRAHRGPLFLWLYLRRGGYAYVDFGFSALTRTRLLAVHNFFFFTRFFSYGVCKVFMDDSHSQQCTEAAVRRETVGVNRKYCRKPFSRMDVYKETNPRPVCEKRGGGARVSI